jgi:hypothetical protein
MRRFLALAILSSVAVAQSASSAGSISAPGQVIPPAHDPSSVPTVLPPTPPGKSTVIGGVIRGVDPVRDQFTLNVFGGRTVKILFDERTQAYRDGVKSGLRDLSAGDHVSVETVLDGTTVFARSIHLLSGSPDGDCQGQVMSYDPGSRELTVRDALSLRPVQLRVPAGTVVVRQGQAASASLASGTSGRGSSDVGTSDLATGTLISVKFQSDNKGHGVASLITVLATPGTTFIFAGNVVFLDLHTGRLALIDPRDNKRYDVSFDSARFPMSRDLHEGMDVTVTADFDGSHYVASAITFNPTSAK